jgi:DNA polymerase III sliding clamp (beta) subunit (PCNA family)
LKINKAELQVALENVKPGLANKELIEQSTSFAFIGDRVVTYNDEISVSHPVTGLENMRGAVKAKALYEFLAKVKDEEIEIEQQENQVVIKAGRSKAGLLFEQEIRLPLEEIGEIGKWENLPEDFLPALSLCYSACSSDMSRPILTCVNVIGDKVEASDSYQIIQYQLKEGVPGDFLIPASSVKELIKYDIQEISLGENWAHFRTPEGTIFSCRTVEGEFPDVEKFLDIEGDEFTFPEDMKEALNRANVFAKKEITDVSTIPTVKVKAKDGELILTAQNEYGWFEEKLKTQHEDVKFSFSIGVEFLISLFDRLKTCKISDNKIGFAGDSWKHVIAVMSEDEE